jgi:hypothetical protein
MIPDVYFTYANEYDNISGQVDWYTNKEDATTDAVDEAESNGKIQDLYEITVRLVGRTVMTATMEAL